MIDTDRPRTEPTAFVIAVGDPFEGLSLFGPYPSHDEAVLIADAEFHKTAWTVVPVCAGPGDVHDGNAAAG